MNDAGVDYEVDYWRGAAKEFETRADELEQEVARLRKVLRRIETDSGGGSLPRARKMAREALAIEVPA